MADNDQLKDKPEPIAARYVKPDEFIPGVPKHDLTESEWRALTKKQRELCLATGVYQAQGGTVSQGSARLIVEPKEGGD